MLHINDPCMIIRTRNNKSFIIHGKLIYKNVENDQGIIYHRRQTKLVRLSEIKPLEVNLLPKDVVDIKENTWKQIVESTKLLPNIGEIKPPSMEKKGAIRNSIDEIADVLNISFDSQEEHEILSYITNRYLTEMVKRKLRDF